MTISLQIRMPDEQLLDDAALESPLAEARRALLRDVPYLGGAVLLVGADGTTLDVPDSMDHLVPRLCLAGPAVLESGQPLSIGLFCAPDTLTLTPNGKQLEVTTTWGPALTLPLAQTVKGLQAAGDRFLRFMQTNLGDVPVWADKIEDMRRWLPDQPGIEAEDDLPDGDAERQVRPLSDADIDALLAERDKADGR